MMSTLNSGATHGSDVLKPNGNKVYKRRFRIGCGAVAHPHPVAAAAVAGATTRRARA